MGAPMTGAFAQWQPRYAEHGVATFPVAANKRPAVKHWQRIGLRGSEQLAIKFADADAFGVVMGRRNRISVLDVDSNDERLLADALARHGQTPFVVRTGGGNFQAWYRHNGEPRKVRAFPGLPIDVLGGGFVVAPPSIGASARYEIVTGSLADLDRLPALKGLDGIAARPEPAPGRHKDEARNNRLWRHCMAAAPDCDDLDQLIDVARTFNATFNPPLETDAEVVKTAKSAWSYEERGRNWIGRAGQMVAFDHGLVDRLMSGNDPDALLLLVKLRRHHWGRDFCIANAMAKSFGWKPARLAAARRRLLALGEVELIQPSGGHRPAFYRWTSSLSPKGYQ
jgi:hypothetical protein